MASIFSSELSFCYFKSVAICKSTNSSKQTGAASTVELNLLAAVVLQRIALYLLINDAQLSTGVASSSVVSSRVTT